MTETKSCETCRWSISKLGYLGPRVFCTRYKQYRSLFCIDFLPRKVSQ